jgi:DNA-binding transcriptional ArsR family regulator
VDKVFEALASTPRRKILAYLAEVDLTAGEIAARFEMSKPAISKHLQILENAGLVTSEKRGQFVHYALVRENVVNTLNGFLEHFGADSMSYGKESSELKRLRKERRRLRKKEKKESAKKLVAGPDLSLSTTFEGGEGEFKP